jgi:hypothetical protein
MKNKELTLKQAKRVIKTTLDEWLDHPDLDKALSLFPVKTIRLFQSVIDIPKHHVRKRNMARLAFTAHIQSVYDGMLK